MSWISKALGYDAVGSMLHPERGYHDANKQIKKSWEEAMGFQKPYADAGAGQIPILQGAEQELMDPSALLAKWMEKYEMSPYAKNSMGNAREAGLDAASSMGLGGSSSAINNIQKSSSDIMNADRNQFLQDLMEKYMKGVGIGTDIFHTGAATAGNMGNQALDAGGQLAKGALGEKNAPGDMLRNMLAMGAKAFMQGQSGGAAGAA